MGTRRRERRHRRALLESRNVTRRNQVLAARDACRGLSRRRRARPRPSTGAKEAAALGVAAVDARQHHGTIQKLEALIKDSPLRFMTV